MYQLTKNPKIQALYNDYFQAIRLGDHNDISRLRHLLDEAQSHPDEKAYLEMVRREALENEESLSEEYLERIPVFQNSRQDQFHCI